MKCSLPIKNSQNFCYLHIINLQIVQNLSTLIHFVHSFSIVRIFGNIHQNIQKIHLKMKSLKTLKCSLLQAKHLVISQEKWRGNIVRPVQSFAKKYCCRAIYD